MCAVRGSTMKVGGEDEGRNLRQWVCAESGGLTSRDPQGHDHSTLGVVLGGLCTSRKGRGLLSVIRPDCGVSGQTILRLRGAEGRTIRLRS